jgi:NAD(P)H-flavin reductase
MAFVQHPFRLTGKKSLTADVFELTFDSDSAPAPKPGQYILFHLPSGLKRAYSISYSSDIQFSEYGTMPDGSSYYDAQSVGNRFHFIIKRMPFEASGSAEICDSEIGAEILGMGPLGHFVLTEGDIPRLFVGTGTGFAPLYYQIRSLEDRKFSAKTEFAFGVRNVADLFYQEEFERLSASYPHFSFAQYLSQDSLEGTKTGYVTDCLTPEYVSQFREFYVCGSPVMVKSVRETLAKLGIEKECVKFEQY